MKRWSWLMAIALSVSMLGFAGCEDDDDDEEATATTTTIIVTNAPAPTPTPTPTPAPAVTTQVLLDTSGTIDGSRKARFDAVAAPGDGTITFSADWTSFFIDGSPHPANLWLWFEVLPGGLTDAGHDSPWEGAQSVTAGSRWSIMIGNDNADTIVNVNVRAVWTAD